MKKLNCNKKAATAVLAAAVAMSTALSGCGERTDSVIVRESETPSTGFVCAAGCTCTGCICCGTDGMANNVPAAETETESETVREESTVPETEQASETGSPEAGGQEQTPAQEQTTAQEEPDTSGLSEIERLSEGRLRRVRSSRRTLRRRGQRCTD